MRAKLRIAIAPVWRLPPVLAFALLGVITWTSAPAYATDFQLMGGETLSSPRTASKNFSKYLGLTGGYGIDFALKEHAHLESDFLYVDRRFAGGTSIHTLILPLLLKFETSFIMLGAGPYLAYTFGASNDDHSPTDVGGLASLDLGVVLQAGVKLPLTHRVDAIGDVRFMRALNPTYTDPETFYWTQIQACIGLRMKIGKTKTQ